YGSHVIAPVGCGQFDGDESAQATKSRRRGALPAYFSIEWVRQAHLHLAVDGFQVDEAVQVSLLDRRRTGDSGQRPEFDWFTDGEHVYHVAYLGWHRADPRLDQFQQARRHHGLAGPVPIAALGDKPAVGDLPFDDIAQIQRITLGQLPQVAGCIRV